MSTSPRAPAAPSASGPGPSAPSGRPVALGALILAIAIAAAYIRTFPVPLVFDDGPAITENPTLRHLASAFFPPETSTVGGRPLLNLSLALDYAVSGPRVWSYHATNLAIHILAALTLFGVVRRTLAEWPGRAATAAAFCSALLWALHPLETESVTYIVQRAESLMGLFYLLTLYGFIRAAGDGSRPGPWWALSVGACLLGMATKEVMATAPGVVLLYDRTFVSGSFRGAWKRHARYYLSLAATWILLAALVLSTHGRAGTAGFGTSVPWSSYALTQFSALLHYLRLCFWPYPLIFDYGSGLVRDPSRVVVSAVMVAALVAVTLWAMVRRPGLGFLGACFFIVLAPSSSVVPIATETMAEHRMYLPLAAVTVLAVLVLFRALPHAALPVGVTLAAVLFVLTWERNRLFLSDKALWADTVAHNPTNERAHNNLGYLLANDPGRWDAAIAQYEEALRLKPDYVQAHSNLANLLVNLPGRLAEGIAHYRSALEIDPTFVDAQYNLACALEKIAGHADEAIAHYREAIRLKPDHVQAHFNLGCALDKVPGHRAEAIAEYETALRLQPDFAAAHFNLAGELERESGRTDEAIAQYREALRLKPDYAEAHHSLGVLYQLKPGEAAAAQAEYREAIRLKPSFYPAHFNLAFLLDSVPGGRDEAMAEYERTLHLNPQYAEAHYDLGCDLLRSRGREREAVEQFRAALAVQPLYVAARCNLGNALNSLGQVSEAVTQYEEAERQAPDDPLIHLNLAVILMNGGGRTVEAAAELRQVLRLQPANATARRLLGALEPNLSPAH